MARRIGIGELRELLARPRPPLLLDLRSRAAYAMMTERLAGDLRIPPEELAARLDELPRDRPLVTY